MQSLPLRHLSIDEPSRDQPVLIEQDDPLTNYNRSPHIEPFHRQRRIDGTLSFLEQIATMQHIVSTNGLDGQYSLIEDTAENSQHPGGIWKETFHTGMGHKPTIGTNIRIHYYAYFEHRDEPFDSSFKRRRPLGFRLGKCEVLPGFDLAVASMQRRERAKFIISSDLLYGQLGCPPHIPESAWCLYVVELSSTNEYSTVIHDEQLSIETANRQHIDDFSKRIRLAQTLRNTGNEEYANGHLERALRSYNKARQLIHNRVTLIDSKNEEQYHQLLLKLHLNSAQCYLRLDNFDRCLQASRDALLIEPNNVKAMFRATVSLRSLNQLDAADKYLKKAMGIDPHNRDLVAESARLREARESVLPPTNETPTRKESTITDQVNAKEIDDLLSDIAISDEFRSKAESILMESSHSSTVQRQQFTDTEYYYLELLARRQRLPIDEGVLHIRQ